MENRNLEKALDIVSKLITGEELTERGDNSSLYQEYNNNAEIYDIVHMSLKKLNLSGNYIKSLNLLTKNYKTLFVFFSKDKKSN